MRTLGDRNLKIPVTIRMLLSCVFHEYKHQGSSTNRMTRQAKVILLRICKFRPEKFLFKTFEN